MKAAQRNVPDTSDVWMEKISGITIPWGHVAVYLTLAVGFFLLGFLPTWFKADRAMEQRDAAQREVRLNQLENALGAATIDVQRGEFEPARQTMSEFFTKLRAQIDANDSVFSATQREQLRPLLSQRDEVITLLARTDPAAADRLFAMYSSYKRSSK
jgi:hypothetical protein